VQARDTGDGGVCEDEWVVREYYCDHQVDRNGVIKRKR